MIRNLARAVSWHRRKLAALAALVAVLATIAAARPAPAETVEVVVAATGLTGGHRLAEADLVVARFPRELAPADVRTESALIGRTLGGSVSRGAPITAASLLGDLAGVEAGEVVAPINFPDPALVALLQPGVRIDVIAAGSGGGRVVARDVRVVTVPQTTESGPMAGSGSAMVLVATTPETATALAGAASSGQLSLVLS